MALYWHVDDKEALLASIADRLWEQAAQTLDGSLAKIGPADDDGWGQLRLTLDALVDVMRAHPAAAELVPVRVMASDAGLDVTERTLTFLAHHGFDLAQASDLGRFVLNSAVMLVSTQPGIEIPKPEERVAHQRQQRIALTSLPPDRYPTSPRRPPTSPTAKPQTPTSRAALTPSLQACALSPHRHRRKPGAGLTAGV